MLDGAGLRFELKNELSNGSSESGFVVEFSGIVHAYKNCCPHLGVELDWVPGMFFDVDQTFLICSTHGARFAPDTGKCISGPCVGRSLTPLTITEENDKLYVQGR